MRYTTIFITAIIIAAIGGACKIHYDMHGATIAADVKTVSVQLFPNRASIVTPLFSQNFTDALKDKVQSQTSLRLIATGQGDVNFEGEIKDYSTAPMAIQSNNTAAQNRFTIAIRVKFTNGKDPKSDFDQVFSKYVDYSSSQTFTSVESGLATTLIDELTEEIFNKAFVNW